MIEILSPVGSPKGLSAPMDGGCDAVYLGGKTFGARAMTDNFSDKELEGAIGYAHDRGVNVYVTVNTIIRQDEMEEAVSFVRFLSDVGADAVLIQDLGLLKNISNIDISKHASTQMQIHSLNGLRWCADNGLDRAVLARELTMEELKAIVPDSPIETEVFVQGGMCYCMSGGCYMSAYIKGSSANRGMCLRPCRSYYDGDEESGLLMNIMDLQAIDYVKELSNLGVKSIKIEGRAKKPVYAYLTAKIYSMIREGRTGPELDEALYQLKIVFNRGSSVGYLGGIQPIVQPVYSGSRGVYLCEADIRNNRIQGMVEGISEGDGMMICKGSDIIGGFNVRNTSDIKVPFRIKDGWYELRKTSDPRIQAISDVYENGPVLRGNTSRRKVKLKLNKHHIKPVKPELSFYISDLEGLDAALPYADRIYFDNPLLESKASGLCGDVEFVRMLPRFDALDEYSYNDVPVMISNLAHYKSCIDAPRIYASSVMNIFNPFNNLDVYQTTLSIEMSQKDIANFTPYYNGRCEVMAFGRIEVMYTREPSLKEGIITDENGRTFHVYKDTRGFTRVQNSSDADLLDNIDELGGYGVSSIGLDLRNRSPELIQAVGDMCRNPDQEKHDLIFDLCGRRTTQAMWVRGVR